MSYKITKDEISKLVPRPDIIIPISSLLQFKNDEIDLAEINLAASNEISNVALSFSKVSDLDSLKKEINLPF